MSKEFLGDRRRALEDQFFARQEQELIERLRTHEQVAARTDALRQASGIDDDAVLEHLASLDISAATLAALALIPLVAVAWADGKVDLKERDAILKAAGDEGLRSDDPSLELLRGWLDRRPDRELIVAWREYVGALGEHLDPAALNAVRTDLLRRARQVASASGGILGLGNKVSPEEEEVLADLEGAFG